MINSLLKEKGNKTSIKKKKPNAQEFNKKRIYNPNLRDTMKMILRRKIKEQNAYIKSLVISQSRKKKYLPSRGADCKKKKINADQKSK